MLIGKDHAPWLKKVAKSEFKWVIFATFLLSSSINIGHGFEYQVRAETLLSPTYIYTDDAVYSSTFNYTKLYIDQYPSVNTNVVFLVYSIVYFFVNFIIFFAVNTVIEVKIVQRMHTELESKRNRLARMRSHLVNANVESEDAKKERRVIVMVVISSIINFILRIPDFFIFLEATSNSAVVRLDNIYPGFTALLLDVSYLAYILTFSFNVFLFYTFNSKFKEAFVALFLKNKP
jgi:hypothetical protein